MKINLIKLNDSQSFLNCIDEIEDALIQKKDLRLEVLYSKETRLKRFLLKILNTLNFFKWRRNNKEITLSFAMGASFSYLLPSMLRAKYNYLYMYDAWPRFHHYIENSCKSIGVRVIFFSSKQVTLLFEKLNTNIKAFWIPEAINIDQYKSFDVSEKSIDVLEFGRKFEKYHECIVDVLYKQNKVHLYEKKKGDIVFKTRQEFIEGLAKSKISICIPSDVTHPERAENISSMTLRYLQSMVSKCLIVGVMPQEMIGLFDYMPIVEIDFKNPENQIINILDNYDDYLALINKNYEEVLNKHTWDKRLGDILEIIKNETY